MLGPGQKQDGPKGPARNTSSRYFQLQFGIEFPPPWVSCC